MFWLFLFLWLVYAQSLNVQVLAVGVVLSAALYWFAKSRVHSYRPLPLPVAIRNIPLVVAYAFALVREVIRASIVIMRLIYSRQIEIDPLLVYFSSDLHNRLEQVVLANEIILTPGTTVIGLEDGEFCVHSLTEGLVDDVDTSVFVRYLQQFEERRAEYEARHGGLRGAD